MHMHTRERPFACTHEGCNKMFCDREGLIQHENGHTKNKVQRCGDESCNQTFSKPFQLHCHSSQEHEKSITSAMEVRPIKLRLSQPKRQNPESLEDSPRKRLLIRLPMTKKLGDTSTLELTEAHEGCSDSKICAKPPTNRMEGSDSHHDARPSKSSSTSEASGNYRVFSRGSILAPTAVSHIPKSKIRLLAPAPHPTFKSRSAENNDHRPYTKRQSGKNRTPVYTRVCGAYSREKVSPEQKFKPSGGPYRCPRCDTVFTRARGVKAHFVGCITNYGNPDSLKWTDHPSLHGTVKFYARNGQQSRKAGFVPQAADVRRSEKKHRESVKNALPGHVVRKPLSLVIEENKGSVKPVSTPPRRDALLQQDIVWPIRKRRDALRRSKYHTETIARDVLLAMGSHPSMDPLNAHLDILRQRFKSVNLKSNMSTFRWDLVDPEQEPEREPEPEPERQAVEEVEPAQSTSTPSEVKGNEDVYQYNDIQWRYYAPSSLPSQTSTKQGILHNKVSFRVFSPGRTHFGPMSTIFARVSDGDPSARIMYSNRDELWAAIFTMLEDRYNRQNLLVRAAVRKYTNKIVGWVACHEVDTFEAGPLDPSVYLDWTTAAHLLPSQLSRFTATKDSAEEEVERSNQRNIGQGLVSTIQARATEAQMYLVPIRRLVINALVVDSSHQGCGVASALLRSITEIADVKKRPVWVQAPEDPAVAQGLLKAGLFRRAGFTCVGELNLDLNSYASGFRKRDRETAVTFSPYKWNYMLRWPQRPVPKNTTAAVKSSESISLA